MLIAAYVQAAQAQYHRIITLSPTLTELVYAVGGGTAVVGVSRYSDYPAAAVRHPIVADYASINIEQVLVLKPDLVLAESNQAQTRSLQHLQQLGISVKTVSLTSLSDIPKVLRFLGSLVHTELIADKIAHRFEQDLSIVKKKYRKVSRKKVFLELSERPLMTLNEYNSISIALNLCGGVNVFSDLPSLSGVISIASLLERQPQVILKVNPVLGWQAYWRPWTQILAVRQHALWEVPDSLLRLTPRLLEGSKVMCREIHMLS